MSDYFVNRDDEVARGLRYISDPSAIVVVSGEKKIGKTFLSRHLVKVFESNLPKHQGADLIYIAITDTSNSFHDFRRQIALHLDDPSLLQGGLYDFFQRLEKSISYKPPHPTVITIDDFSFQRYEDNNQGEDKQNFIEFFKREFHDLRVVVTTRDFVSNRERYPRRAVNIDLAELPDESYLMSLIEHTLERKAIRVEPNILLNLVDSIQTHIGRNPGIIVELLHHCETPDRIATWIESKSPESVFDFHSLYVRDWDGLEVETQLLLHWIASLGGRISEALLHVFTNTVGQNLPSSVATSLSSGFLRRESVQGTSYFAMGKTFMSFLAERSDFDADSNRSKACALFVQYLENDWENTQLLKFDYKIIESLYSWAISNLDVDFCVRFYNVVLDPMFSLGLFSERVELAKMILSRDDLGKATESLGALYNAVVSTCALIGEFETAELHLEKFRGYCNQHPEVEHIYLRSSGYLDYRRGDVARALKNADSSAEKSATNDDKHTEIDALCLVVSSHLYHGSQSDAEEKALFLLDLVDSLPWGRGRAYPLRDLAESAILKRDFENAEQFAKEALDTATKYRDIRQMIRIRLTQSRIQLFCGRGSETVNDLQEIVRLAQRYRLLGEELEAKATLRRAARWPSLFWNYYYQRYGVKSRFEDVTIAGD